MWPTTYRSLRLLTTLALIATACDVERTVPTRALFALPSGDDARLYDAPFPNDLRRRDDGSVDLVHLSHDQPALIQRYLELAGRERYGFSCNGAISFRFSGAIDPNSLPADAAASLAGGSAVQLIDVDRTSPDFGRPVPIRWKFTPEAGAYIGANHLAVLPMAGFPLRTSTRYAVVITESLLAADGRRVIADPLFEQLLADDPAPNIEQQHASYAALRDYLDVTGRTGVISATVFTTGDHIGLVSAMRDVLLEQPAPVPRELELAGETRGFWEIHGKYDAPNFRGGKPPFVNSGDGGTVELDAAGRPVIARSETIRFALTIPKGAMPAGGWPLLIVAHGTGGSYRSFVRDGTAGHMAAIRDGDRMVAQVAAISIDQPLHGPRTPTAIDPQTTMFNILNPESSIFNLLQSAVDDVTLLRVARTIEFRGLPRAAKTPKTPRLRVDLGYRVRLDSRRVAFMGHSQGGLSGSIFLAIEPNVGAGLLSGAGANGTLTILNKTVPSDISSVVELALGEEIDEFHPLIALIQQLLDPTDPGNYARRLVREPPPGARPKHLMLTQGLIDHWTPLQTSDALAVAIGLPLVGPALREVAGFELRGFAHQQLPTAGNVSIGHRSVTAGLLQFDSLPLGDGSCTTHDECGRIGYAYCGDEGRCRSEGHFVVFDHPDAIRQSTMFFGTFFRDDQPSFVTP